MKKKGGIVVYNPDTISAQSDYATSAAELDAISSVGEGIIGALLGMGVMIIFIGLVISIISIIANWKLFTKAGEKGWKCLIPIYNTVVLFKIAGLSPWLVLGYLATIIPVVGGLISLGISIYLYINLAKAFGEGAGFAVGLILLNTIFMMILAFGSSQYQLNKREDVPAVE